jgi:hypothetical protein
MKTTIRGGKMKFKVGDLANGHRTSEVEVEYDSWFDAVEATLAGAGLYLIEIDEDGNEVV